MIRNKRAQEKMKKLFTYNTNTMVPAQLLGENIKKESTFFIEKVIKTYHNVTIETRLDMSIHTVTKEPRAKKSGVNNNEGGYKN